MLWLISTMAYTQNIKLNLLVNGNHTKSTYTYTGGNIAENILEKQPLGFSIGLQSEFAIAKNWTIFGGLTYHQKNFHPRLALGGPYGGLVDPTGTLNTIIFPYLKRHHFHLLSIPLGIKFNPWSTHRISPYFSLGFDTAFRLAESEAYQDIFENEEWFKEFREDDIVIKDKDIAFFGTNLNVGIGLRLKMSDQWSLLLNQQMSILAFRAANEKFKKNGSLLFEDSWLTLSQMAIGIGIQRSF